MKLHLLIGIGAWFTVLILAINEHTHKRTQPTEYKEFGVWTQDSNGNLVPMKPK